MVIFQFAIFKARVDQQEYINGTITAADFKGSLTVVHNGRPPEIVNKNNSGRAVVQQKQSNNSQNQKTLLIFKQTYLVQQIL